MFDAATLGTHASWFIHIDPGAINVQTSLGVVEASELCGPVTLCLWIEPILKGVKTGPMSTRGVCLPG